ncbi:hypothetical protein SEA_LAZERLEMON_40 [Streptomyces phage LazerLemon]|nr:hypothetical protein SEA_LAZERLEMON_40 [Streptomyces phage LazerLemon]
MVESMTIHLPGPFSVSTRGAWRASRANDREQLRKAREGWRELRALFTRDKEPKKIKNLRRERARELDRLARQHRRDGTIT